MAEIRVIGVVQIDAAARAGAPVVEIHTGHYCDLQDKRAIQTEYERIVAAVNYGNKLGLQVNAGHGLHYHNVAQIAALEGIRELNIGHAIVARAVFTGFQEAVREMKRLMVEARQ